MEVICSFEFLICVLIFFFRFVVITKKEYQKQETTYNTKPFAIITTLIAGGFFICKFYIMKTQLEILEIMQMILNSKECDDLAYWYAHALKDLAKLIWEDPNNYWVKD